MKPNLLLLVLLFVAHSFAGQFIVGIGQGSGNAEIALFYRIVGQSHQKVANTSVNMYFDCDGNSINAKNGTCKDLGQHK